MKIKILLLGIFLCCTFILDAQTKVVDDEGDIILLNDDGSWYYESEVPSDARYHPRLTPDEVFQLKKKAPSRFHKIEKRKAKLVEKEKQRREKIIEERRKLANKSKTPEELRLEKERLKVQKRLEREERKKAKEEEKRWAKEQKVKENQAKRAAEEEEERRRPKENLPVVEDDKLAALKEAGKTDPRAQVEYERLKAAKEAREKAEREAEKQAKKEARAEKRREEEALRVLYERSLTDPIAKREYDRIMAEKEYEKGKERTKSMQEKERQRLVEEEQKRKERELKAIQDAEEERKRKEAIVAKAREDLKKKLEAEKSKKEQLEKNRELEIMAEKAKYDEFAKVEYEQMKLQREREKELKRQQRRIEKEQSAKVKAQTKARTKQAELAAKAAAELEANRFVYPGTDCQPAFDEMDPISKHRRTLLKKRYFFGHTDESIKKSLKGKDFLVCYGAVGYMGKVGVLDLTFIIESQEAQRSFGYINAGATIEIELLNGETVSLSAEKPDNGKVNVTKGITTYNTFYFMKKDVLKKVKRSEVSRVKMVWASGFETYEVYELDFFLDQFNCLANID